MTKVLLYLFAIYMYVKIVLIIFEPIKK